MAQTVGGGDKKRAGYAFSTALGSECFTAHQQSEIIMIIIIQKAPSNTSRGG